MVAGQVRSLGQFEVKSGESKVKAGQGQVKVTILGRGGLHVARLKCTTKWKH